RPPAAAADALGEVGEDLGEGASMRDLFVCRFRSVRIGSDLPLYLSLLLIGQRRDVLEFGAHQSLLSFRLAGIEIIVAPKTYIGLCINGIATLRWRLAKAKRQRQSPPLWGRCPAGQRGAT